MTDTVRASSSAKDEAPPSTSGAGAGAGAGAAAGAGATLVELLPAKKSAREKSVASFSGFCLLQLKMAETKVVEISTATCFAAATAVATVSVDLSQPQSQPSCRCFLHLTSVFPFSPPWSHGSTSSTWRRLRHRARVHTTVESPPGVLSICSTPG